MLKTISWNIRGLEALDRKYVVKRFLNMHKEIDCLMLQELKLVGFTLEIGLKSIWREATPFYTNHPKGKGGATILLNPKWANKVVKWGQSPYERAVWAIIQNDNSTFGFCSIYASNDYQERGVMWEWFAKLKDIPWLLGGDFNMVNNVQDKQGGNKVKWKGVERIHWERMVNKMRLTDPIAGRRESISQYGTAGVTTNSIIRESTAD